MADMLPGTPHHQQILRTIIEYYQDDARILAIVLFGSLGRGDWDAYSDLDLDIVLKDNVLLDVAAELAHLCAAIQAEHDLTALIIPKTDEGDVVLSNLVEFSIRYHALHATKPAILDSMMVLAGTLSLEQIRAAGEANRVPQPELTKIVDQCLRYTLEVHNALARQRLWLCLELLHRIRGLLMQLFAATQGAARPVQYFDAMAPPDLQARLKRFTPHPTLDAVQTAFAEIIQLVDHDLGAFGGSEYRLTAQQRIILDMLKARSGERG